MGKSPVSPSNEANSHKKSDTASPIQSSSQTQTIVSPRGSLPMSEPTPETTPQQVILSPEQQASQEKFFKKIFGFATDIYVGMGLVETDDEEEEKVRKTKTDKRI